MAHIIRLRGAWTCETLKKPNGQSSIRFSRQFGCSAGLKAASRVNLAIDEVTSPAAIILNGQPLGTVAGTGAAEKSRGQHCPARFDITTRLQPRNVLAIDISAEQQTISATEDDYVGLVQLEVD